MLVADHPFADEDAESAVGPREERFTRGHTSVIYTTRDSGEREHFAGGAHRDTRENKGRYDLVSPFLLERLAKLLERGAEKYSARNWEHGFPFSRCLDSAVRHLYQYIAGEPDEDHLAAAVFNLGAVIHYEEMIRRGMLPGSLDDRPTYSPDTPQSPAVA